MVNLPPSLEGSYPFKNHFLPVSSHGKLHYVDEGPREDEAVVLLHGNPTWSFFYRNLIQDLVKKGHRVIAPDHLGCGFSSKNPEDEYSLRSHAKNLGKLIDALGLKKVSLLVHDWGGAIGFTWAVKNREKLSQIVITNTAAFLSKNIPWRIAFCKVPFFNSFVIRRLNGFAYPALHMASAKGLSKEAKEGLLLPYNSFDNRIAISKFVEDIPLQKNHPSYKTLAETEEMLPLIQVPKLILWGKKDFCFDDSFLKRWKEIYPEARVKEFTHSGHYLFEDEKEAVNHEILNFLEQDKPYERPLTH